VPDLDALIIFLIWAKMGLGHKNLAALLSIKKAKIALAINCIQLPLYAALSQKWWQNCMHPLPLANTLYPYIALLVDSMTVETCQPGGPFEEVKSYFDVKNGIYGIKKEVAVSAHPPHYALFHISLPSWCRTRFLNSQEGAWSLYHLSHQDTKGAGPYRSRLGAEFCDSW